MKAVEQKFQTLDVFINNASRLETWYPLVETDVKDWWLTWEVNIKGTYIATRAALPQILKGKLKTILTVSTTGAHTTAYAFPPLSSN